MFVLSIVSLYAFKFSLNARQNHIKISIFQRILMIRKFEMKTFSRQPHQQKTLAIYFVKTIWRVVGITEKMNRKHKNDLKGHEDEQ